MFPLKRCLFAAGLGALVSSPAVADYVYTTIDSDHLGFTDVRGINNAGAIVGYNASGAFAYSGGTFTPLPNPPGLVNSALAINDFGVIVGAASDGSIEKGSIYDKGYYSLYSHPGYTYTEFRGINTAGLVTGIAYNAPGLVATQGFLFNPATGVYTDIPEPAGNFTVVNGINSAGQVVGSTSTLNSDPNITSTQSFLRNADGSTQVIQIGTGRTRARGINDAGLITGSYGSTSFIEQAGSSAYQTLNVPGSFGTYAEAINNAGQVSGFFFTDAYNDTLGFIASPATLPTAVSPNGAFVFSVAVIGGKPIFIDPAVATGYDYATGQGNPNTVTLPIGVGDSLYTITVGGNSFSVAGGDAFDFLAHGFASGVSSFEVTGIETDAGLDPLNPAAFVTELTFATSGTFTGTQKAIVSAAPEPDTAALAVLAVTAGWWARRRRSLR